MSDEKRPQQEKGAPPEGWQAEKHDGQRVYHYIRDTMSLCGKLGFFTGQLMPHVPAPKGNEDCAACYRRIPKKLQAASGQLRPKAVRHG